MPDSQTDTFLTAAFRVLHDERRILTSKELVDLAVKKGLLATKGRTPWKTMNARLSTDILEKKETSPFMRSGSSQFALREWSDKIHEYIAPRRVVALFDEDILVFERRLLTAFVPYNGLIKNFDRHHELLSSCFPMRRRLAEEDFSVIQLVSVYIVSFEGKYISYKRTKRLPESRLHDTYSICFGGHLNPDDLMPLFRFSDPNQALYLVMRELNEELRMDSPPTEVKFMGILYDPRTAVSTQHLGLVFSVRLSNQNVVVGERGFLTDMRFECLSELRGRLTDFENWSELIIRSELT